MKKTRCSPNQNLKDNNHNIKDLQLNRAPLDHKGIQLHEDPQCPHESQLPTRCRGSQNSSHNIKE